MSDGGDIWPGLRDAIHSWTGMQLGAHRQGEILRSVGELAAEAGLGSPGDALAAAAQPGQAALRSAIIERAVIGTTWFMRETEGLERLARAMAQRAAANGLRQVRVWSAGCSTGEEPYSIAMVLREAGLEPRVLATDISSTALRIAAAGRYRVTQLERVSAAQRERFFHVNGPSARIDDALASTVCFAPHNLAQGPCPPLGWSSFDAVVCRNVLIYFDPGDAVAIGKSLAAACRRGGFLLVGAVEEPLLRNFAGIAAAGPVGQRLARGTRPQLATPRPAAPAAPAPAPELEAAHHLLEGIHHKRSGDLRLAVQSFRSARFLRQDAWLASYELATCLQSLGENASASEAYRHALGVLERGGPSGLADAQHEVEGLARTAAEACRARLGRLRSQA